MRFFIPLLFSVALMPFHTHAQKEIDGTVSAGDSVTIDIKSVTPKASPLIEILFKAEDNQGYPYWGIEKEHVVVREGMTQCRVVSLEHFTDQAPINIILLLDQSGSMAEDASRVWDKYKVESEEDYEAIDWESKKVRDLITFPLEDAKVAISNFVPNFDEKKDKLGLVAFDHRITVDLPLGTPGTVIQNRLKSIKSEGGTAFYDAIQRGIENIKGEKGINVVIALTDGMDGESKLTPDEIIANANDAGVLVYCIGLGGADTEVLSKIASETDGYFARASNSSSLDSVYQVLERKIRAYYLLKYDSENWSSDADGSDFTLRFKVNEDATLAVPDKVVAYLNEKKSNTLLTYGPYAGGGVVIVSMLALGVWYFRKKRPKKLRIERTFPNPGNGHITLTVKLPSSITVATVQIVDHRGSIVLETDVQDGENTLDISTHARGFYEITLQHSDAKPAQRKYLKNV